MSRRVSHTQARSNESADSEPRATARGRERAGKGSQKEKKASPALDEPTEAEEREFVDEGDRVFDVVLPQDHASPVMRGYSRTPDRGRSRSPSSRRRSESRTRSESPRTHTHQHPADSMRVNHGHHHRHHRSRSRSRDPKKPQRRMEVHHYYHRASDDDDRDATRRTDTRTRRGDTHARRTVKKRDLPASSTEIDYAETASVTTTSADGAVTCRRSHNPRPARLSRYVMDFTFRHPGPRGDSELTIGTLAFFHHTGVSSARYQLLDALRRVEDHPEVVARIMYPGGHDIREAMSMKVWGQCPVGCKIHRTEATAFGEHEYKNLLDMAMYARFDIEHEVGTVVYASGNLPGSVEVEGVADALEAGGSEEATAGTTSVDDGTSAAASQDDGRVAGSAGSTTRRAPGATRGRSRRATPGPRGSRPSARRTHRPGSGGGGVRSGAMTGQPSLPPPVAQRRTGPTPPTAHVQESMADALPVENEEKEPESAASWSQLAGVTFAPGSDPSESAETVAQALDAVRLDGPSTDSDMTGDGSTVSADVTTATS